MLAIVVAGGDYAPPMRLGQWRRRAGLVVAADGGAERALALGLTPDVIVGDMDSVDPATRQRLEALGATVRLHRPDKDETDTELAVMEALDRGADEVVILCALGGRVDHALANVLLLALPELGDRGLIADAASEVRLVTTEVTFDGAVGDLLSLLPLSGTVEGISTEGLLYPLAEATLELGRARGVSNVFTRPEARVSLRHGRLLAIHTRLTDSGE